MIGGVNFKTEVEDSKFLGHEGKKVSWTAKKSTNKNQVHPTAVNANKPSNASEISTTNFQECLRATVLIGQIFGLLPVHGINSKKAVDVRFRTTSWKCLYTLISFCGQLFMMIMCICKVIYTSTSLKATTTIIFYATTCTMTAMFFQIARNWPKLVQDIAKTESLDPCSDKRLLRRCYITCATILSLALVEHILSLLSAFASARQCYPDDTIYEGFVKNFYPWVFAFFAYTPALGIITQFVHFQSTFIWSFSDLVVIKISYFLTSRLEQLNKKLLVAQGKYLPEPFWRSMREEYGRVTQLVRRVDDVIGGIVFMSFANNLFFICFQLFNTLENGLKGSNECTRMVSLSQSSLLGGYESAVYFIFSLVYLIMRSIAVSLIAAQVNSASTVPAPVLYDVPSPVYCTEVQRFLDQVNGDNIALTGLNFFSVTRGLLLSVAGTIVTYELVMVQFNAPSPAATTATPVTTAAIIDALNFTTT